MSYTNSFNSFNPYSQAGQQSVQNYSNISNQYANNPTDIYNNIMKGFSISPAQQYQMHQGEQAVDNNDALRGWSGSGQHAKDLYDYGRNTTDAFQQQYLNNILGIGNTGLNGLGNISNLGFQSSQSQAQLQEARDQINAAKHNSFLSGIFDLLGTGLGGAISEPGFNFISSILGF